MTAKNRNRIQISPHFWMHEFEMKEGTVMIHPSVPVSLEATRADLCERYGEEVELLIAGSTRSVQRNTYVGGVKNSKHLMKFGGIAIDCKARIKRTKEPVPQKVLGEIARRHFDYVKDDYTDGHVHADNRNEKP